MEGTVTLVAEWVSCEEMKALQGVCVLTSVCAREWQYKDFLSDLDDQVWRDLSDEWQKYLSEKEESPAPRKRHVPQRCQIEHCKFPTGTLRKGHRTRRRRRSRGKVNGREPPKVRKRMCQIAV